MTVKWGDVEADCQPYRQGFVTTYLKYQGQATDEVDGRGVVYVTEASFARHMGIAKVTFHRWVKAATKPQPVPQPQPQPAMAAVLPALAAAAASFPAPLPVPTMASFPPCTQVMFALADLQTQLTEVLTTWEPQVAASAERDEIKERLRNESYPLLVKVMAAFGVTP